MHTDNTSDGACALVVGVIHSKSGGDRVAMIRKAMQEGIPLNQIEQRLDWLDYVSESRAADRAPAEQARQGSRSRPVPMHQPARQLAAIRAVREAVHQADCPSDGPQPGDDPVHAQHAQALRPGAP
jgi:hypothetical protein